MQLQSGVNTMMTLITNGGILIESMQGDIY